VKRNQKHFQTPEHRQETLAARRNLKMAASAHAFVRGSTVRFYEWLEERGRRAVPKGPPVWICGDCHSGNLGPVSDCDGKVEIQIRDFDEAVIGNPNHDLIRLALSLASAARGSDLPGVTTARMLEHMMEGYQSALKADPKRNKVSGEKPECAQVVMRRAVSRTWKQLARERLDDSKPDIPRGKRYWPLSNLEQKEIASLSKQEEVRRLATSIKARDDDAEVEVLDAAFWMKGCSSLGRLRFAVLLGVGKKRDGEDLCLMDIKEAVGAAAPSVAGAHMPKDPATRVVEGARHLSPFLGERIAAAKLLNRSVFLRELMPQDLKLEIDELSCEEAVAVARFLAAVVGRAHARQMDAATRKEFLKSLQRRPSSRIDAPSWLWSSVVELAAAHEAAYLEHCRKYALHQGEKARVLR
jgi:uncharacterized protein (DUF2252 family)